MSDIVKPKKQFKSQSVNSLFREQSVPESGVNDVRKSRSPTPTGTKLKLMPRKSRNVLLSSRKHTSESSLGLNKGMVTIQPKAQSEPPSAEAQEATMQGDIEIDPLESVPHKNDYTGEGIWTDLKSRINTEATITRVQLERVATYSPECSRTWSSPSSKLSSFRKGAGSSGLVSLNQSPLTNPVDSQSRLFTDFKLQRARSEQRTVTLNQRQWSSPNIWNSEDRSLSTKSDSAVPWSLDIETLSLDDPFKSSPVDLGSRQGSRTSRFFPSPVVEQNPSFDDFPRQSSSGYGSGIMPQMASQPLPLPLPQYDTIQIPIMTQPRTPAQSELWNIEPLAFNNSSQDLEHDLFPGHFANSSAPPVSIYNPHDYYGKHPTNYTPPRRSFQLEPQSYPEGFASTFYKRGANNFMFIRELQPKLVTSKHRDTVEVRVSFPIPAKPDDDDESSIKMRCHIVNVDVRDLEGRIGGLKVSKAGPSARGRFGSRGRGLGRPPR